MKPRTADAGSVALQSRGRSTTMPENRQPKERNDEGDRPFHQRQACRRHQRALRRRLQPGDRRGAGEGALATKAELDAAVAIAAKAQPAWARDQPAAAGARDDEVRASCSTATWTSWPRCCRREHGKTLPDARGDVQRGLEVVEVCIGAPQLLKGEFTDGAGPGIDMYSMRQPLGVVAGITPFNFPAMIPLWKIAPGAVGRQRHHPQAVRARPLRAADARRTAAGGRPAGRACSRSSTATRKRSTRSSTTTTIQAVGFVGSTPIAAIHLWPRLRQRQARAMLRRRQEPHDHHARRRHGPGGRRAGRRRLRRGRRALHGDFGRGAGGRQDRRRADRAADAARSKS